VDFEWDSEKARSNEQKHKVTFLEATEVFGDVLSSTAADPDGSEGEARFLIFGRTSNGKHLVVSYTERGENLRLISARIMTPHERKAYEQ
jgi:uncharacterized DUF497 family protein